MESVEDPKRMVVVSTFSDLKTLQYQKLSIKLAYKIRILI